MIPFRLSSSTLIVVTLLAAGLSGCSREEEAEAPVRGVQTLVLGSGVSDPFRRFPGEISAAQTSQMSFDVSGRMIERPARQGLVVAQGDLLARLDPENFESRLASATSRATNATEELARRRQLHERGVISVSELEQFKTQAEVAEAAQREARRALEDTRLVAPFDGQVARTLIDNFQNVQAKQPVLIFQDVTKLEVDIDVPERAMSNVAKGMTAEQARDLLEGIAEFPTLAGQQFPLTLESFSTEAAPTARTFRVTFSLAPPEGSNILPGMTCTVLVRRTNPDGQVVEDGIFEVPVQAVTTLNGHASVWKLDPETMTASQVQVEMDTITGESIRVRSDALSPGDEIIIAGARFLSEGMTVRRMR